MLQPLLTPRCGAGDGVGTCIPSSAFGAIDGPMISLNDWKPSTRFVSAGIFSPNGELNRVWAAAMAFARPSCIPPLMRLFFIVAAWTAAARMRAVFAASSAASTGSRPARSRSALY